MTAVFLLFVMVCSHGASNCQPYNAGYYVDRAACERVKPTYITETTDAQCVRKRADPT